MLPLIAHFRYKCSMVKVSYFLFSQLSSTLWYRKWLVIFGTDLSATARENRLTFVILSSGNLSTGTAPTKAKVCQSLTVSSPNPKMRG